MPTTHDPIAMADDSRVSADESLTGVLRELAESGYGASFRPAREPVEGRPAIVCGECGRSSPARDLDVAQERRLEGASDPDDMLLAVAATCPACGARGVIALAYGPEASPEDADLVQAMHAPDQPETESGGDGDEDESQSDPGGDSDPDAGEGFEVPASAHDPTGLGRVGAALDGVAGLDRVAEPLRATIRRRVPDPVLGVLQGRWLGHPLHPVLTDLPIGFWTSAWALDLVGGERAEGVADAFVAAGVVTAVPTLWSGWSDWIELPWEKRRSGLVHAVANGTATALYAASLVSRLRGRRKAGVRLAHTGAALATVGGFLGGHLAFGDD